jgi:hypothetical protein
MSEFSMGSRWDEVKSHIKKASENSFVMDQSHYFVDESEDALVLGCPNKFS